MTEYGLVFRRRLAADEWIAVIEAIHQTSPLAYLYAEEAATIQLTTYRSPQPHWTHGRVFNEQLEIRWSQRRDGQVDLLLLTERPFAGATDWTQDDLSAAASPSEAHLGTVVLLGTSKRHPDSPGGGDASAPKEWAEGTLERSIVYPLDDQAAQKRYAQLKIKTYQVNGRTVLTRMVDLEGNDHVGKL